MILPRIFVEGLKSSSSDSSRFPQLGRSKSRPAVQEVSITRKKLLKQAGISSEKIVVSISPAAALSASIICISPAALSALGRERSQKNHALVFAAQSLRAAGEKNRQFLDCSVECATWSPADPTEESQRC